MFKKIIASIAAMALVMSTAVISVSAADTEKVLLSEEVTMNAWGANEKADFAEGTDAGKHFTFDELMSFENVEVSFKISQADIDGAGTDTWQFTQILKWYAKSWSDPYLYDDVDNKSIASEGATFGQDAPVADTVYTVNIPVATIIADFETALKASALYEATHTTAEFFDGFSIMGGFLTSTITSVKLVDPIAVEPVETEATTAETDETTAETDETTAETDETTAETDETTAETADETDDTPETGVGLAFTLVAIPVVTLVTAAISKKRK